MMHRISGLLSRHIPYSRQYPFSLVEVLLACTLVAIGTAIGGAYWYKQKQNILYEAEQLQTIIQNSHQLMATYGIQVELSLEHTSSGVLVTAKTTPPLNQMIRHPIIPTSILLPSIDQIEYELLPIPFTLLFQPKGASFPQGKLKINDTYILYLPEYINAPSHLCSLSEPYTPPAAHSLPTLPQP